MDNNPSNGEGPGLPNKRKKFFATLFATFALAAGFPVQADAENDFRLARFRSPAMDVAELQTTYMKSYDTVLEEVRVTAQDLSPEIYTAFGIYTMSVGLGSTVLIHQYDANSDTWKFVGTDLSAIKQ